MRVLVSWQTRSDERDYVIFDLQLTSNISGPSQNIKHRFVDFVPLIWGLFLPIFSFLASKLWEEIEVTDRQTFFTNSSEKIWQLTNPLDIHIKNFSNAQILALFDAIFWENLKFLFVFEISKYINIEKKFYKFHVKITFLYRP